ncbi:MFS transporter [Geothrix sp. PMB-07]|uniref:MFS transporter n=1 Tax=Geothrix sp. PMB-07 TaxID=3068640 RepID=UPI00274084AB|nr:MFS transporter [Geothrix sp. PMB-07]WLT31012.1 MFS transporter [Geothrix sp. PMB-07]
MHRSLFKVGLIMLIFVVISFVTNILDPMGTDVQASFRLTEAQVGYLASALFIAYAVMSIPAGILVEKFSAKAVLLVAFAFSAAGALAFAARPSFAVAIPALFVIGVGFAMLQVVINPLLRVSGGEEHYAFFGNLSQMIFALGSTVSPHLYVYLVSGIHEGKKGGLIGALTRLVPGNMSWVALYWVFAAILGTMLVVIALVRLPKVALAEDEKVGSFSTILHLLKSKTVWAYFVGIVCYVGTEQGIATKIKPFLMNCHQVDPDLANRVAVSGFWGAMTLGCAVGLVLLKLFDAKKILVVFMAGGILTLLAALFGNRTTALVALPMMGFWCSVGWPLVFALALNSVDKHHGTFAGILCTGILGGAILPPLVGVIADHAGPMGLRYGLLAVLGTFAYLLLIGFWANPIISNATLGKSEPQAGQA